MATIEGGQIGEAGVAPPDLVETLETPPEPVEMRPHKGSQAAECMRHECPPTPPRPNRARYDHPPVEAGYRFGVIPGRTGPKESCLMLMTHKKQTDLGEYITGLAEDCYRSKKLEPLGKSTAKNVPEKCLDRDFVFGVSRVAKRDPRAGGSAVFPEGDHKMDNRHFDSDLKTVTRPIDRKYQWPSTITGNPHMHRFGGKGAETVKPQLGEENVVPKKPFESPIFLDTNGVTIEDLRPEKFKRSRADILGKGREPTGRQKELGRDHSYGGKKVDGLACDVYDGPQWGVHECMKGTLEEKPFHVGVDMGKIRAPPPEHIPKDVAFGHPPPDKESRITSAELLGKDCDSQHLKELTKLPYGSLSKLRDVFDASGVEVPFTDEELESKLAGDYTIAALQRELHRLL